MTTTNNKVSIHPALLSVIMAGISAAIVAWGIISVNNVKTTQNTKDIGEIKTEMKAEIKTLDEKKADKDDLTMIYTILNEMKTDIKDIKDGKVK